LKTFRDSTSWRSVTGHNLRRVRYVHTVSLDERMDPRESRPVAWGERTAELTGG